MATKPIDIDADEIRGLIALKCAGLASYLQATMPAYVDTVGVGDTLKRIGELSVALAEAVSALPKPKRADGATLNAPN